MATTTNNGWETPDDTDLVKDGALAIRTLGSAIDTSVGTGLLAWQTYAPTFSGGWANGNGTYNAAKYCQIGKTVHVVVHFTTGTTTTKGTSMVISLPVAAAATGFFVGGTRFVVAGAVTYGFAIASNASTANVYALGTAGAYLSQTTITSAIPGTWAASGDTLQFSMTYQAA